MFDASFFSFSSYHLILAIGGTIVKLARWFSRAVWSREPAAAPLMIFFGALAALAFPNLPAVSDPRDAPKIWEVV